MYIRFDGKVSIAQGKYEEVQQLLSRASLTERQLDAVWEVKPKWHDEVEDKARYAGNIAMLSATDDTFTGCWWITDEDTPQDRAYLDMLANNGMLDGTVVNHTDFRQHLVGGMRLDEDTFAVTSVLRSKRIHRKGPSISPYKIPRLEWMHHELVGDNLPQIGSFNYKKFMGFANAVNSKRQRVPAQR